MKALVFHKPGDVRVEKVADPKIKDPTDAIVRVTRTAICGSDLHFYNGYIPQVRSFIPGHEFVGVIEDLGPAVVNLRVGDRVVVPFPIACGDCWFCIHGWPTQCSRSNPNYGPEGGLLKEKGAALFGYTDLYGGYNGGQAEFVRVPFANFGPRKIPDALSFEDVHFLTDIFPTGWAAAKWGGVSDGDTVAVFGAGPVGVMAMKAAWLQGAGRVFAVDILPYRLRKAFETANVETINSAEQDPVAVLREATAGRGADVCIDAVGLECHRNILTKVADVVLHHQAGDIDVLQTALRAVRRGGRLSCVGVYSTKYDNFPLGQLMDKGVQFMAGQAPVHNFIDELIDLTKTGKVVTKDITTHELPLEKAVEGYKMFAAKADECVKVVLTP